SYETTIASPKKYLLPPSETLLSFDARDNRVGDYAAEINPRVIFGAHACDINAINRLDLVFRDGRYPDPYYTARRNATLIVGLSCMPQSTCFCHLWDADEARFGYDLFLQDIGGKYLVSISSVEAANILEAACNPARGHRRGPYRVPPCHASAPEAFNDAIPDIQDVAMLMDAFHKDPFWEELGGRCLSCTACSAVCPTCFCFDIQDTFDPLRRGGSASACGTRAPRRSSRRWPAATTSAATAHRRAAPHVPQAQRVLANHDRMLCVGCGRCVKACKANINPIEVLDSSRGRGQDAQ
ncbi:MAG: 4Fe-4S dicluster domain-containing protein, partial [Eggerthellaceae bacterium]